jgi:hypothetical protein
MNSATLAGEIALPSSVGIIRLPIGGYAEPFSGIKPDPVVFCAATSCRKDLWRSAIIGSKSSGVDCVHEMREEEPPCAKPTKRV